MGITLILLGFHAQQKLEKPTKIKKEYFHLIEFKYQSFKKRKVELLANCRSSKQFWSTLITYKSFRAKLDDPISVKE